MNSICEIFGVSQEEILSKSRKKEVALARQIGMYVARNYMGFSLRKVADMFKRSHPTVSHTIQKLEELTNSGNMVIKSQIDRLARCVTGQILDQSV
jgi:chromosomal replication initiator protein